MGIEGGSLTTCATLTFTASNSSEGLLGSLNSIVEFSQRKIAEQEVVKKDLVKEMLAGEKQSVQFAQERNATERLAGDLDKNISRLRKDISTAAAQQRGVQVDIDRTEQSITSTSRAISASSKTIAKLRGSIKAHEAQIAYMNRRIAEERSKRGCGIFKRRRRRVRRGWRIRRVRFRGVRNIGRKIGRGVRNIGRAVRKIVKLPVCLVRGLISRLRRTKKRLEDARNKYAHNLMAVQRQKRIKDAQLRRLLGQKTASLKQLRVFQVSLAKLNIQLKTDRSEKTRTDQQLNQLRSRIAQLTEFLRSIEKRLTSIRKQKSEVLGVITELRLEVSRKVGLIDDLQSADSDVIEEILDDISEINGRIEASIGRLRSLLCV